MTTTWAQRRKDRIDDLAGGRSLTAEAFRRLRRDPIAITGAVIVGAFVVIAILSPLIAPHSATEPFPQLQRTCARAPSPARRTASRWARTSSGATSTPG